MAVSYIPRTTSVPVAVSQGGTNATTTADARQNLGIRLFAWDTKKIENKTIASQDVALYDIDVTKSGYNLYGIIGWNVGNSATNGNGCSYINVYECHRQNNTTARLRARNTGSSSAKVDFTLYLLYIESFA